MSEMSHGGFDAACDQLSSKVDPELFERFRWVRDEAPKLARLVELIKGAPGNRTDIEINEEGGTQDAKRFVIKVHGERIAGLGVALNKGRAVVSIGRIERSDYRVAKGEPLYTNYANVDEAWIGDTLSTLLMRIERPAPPPPEPDTDDESEGDGDDA